MPQALGTVQLWITVLVLVLDAARATLLLSMTAAAAR